MLLELLNSEAVATASEIAMKLPGTPGADGADVLSFGASLVIVVGVILVLGWVYSRSRGVGGNSSDVINIVATRALGPKERLIVVEIADQQLLVGMTASGVQTLHVFDSPVVEPESDARQPGFAGRLRSALKDLGT